MGTTPVGPADHRPWPLPARSWVMGMRWHDLAFLHWPLPAHVLRPHLPAGLALDLFDGSAWLGVVPFGMRRVRPRFVPPLPWLSAFLETNVRTYVVADDKPGVWFFSLDAANPLAVRGARRWFHLPYYNARMSLALHGSERVYRSMRTHRGAPPAAFRGRYRPVGEVYRSQPGQIDHWLTERYAMYAADRHGRLYRGEIHHPPWPLQPAAAEIELNSMAEPLGVELTGQPLVHFAKVIDVIAWKLAPLGTL